MCPTGKCAINKYDLAIKARARSSKRYDKPMAIYRCATCGDWHLGKPGGTKRPLKTIHRYHH